MKVVIEYSLALSMLSVWCELKLVGLILKSTPRLVLLSCLIGGVVSVSYPLFHILWPIKILLTICTICLCCLISFKYISFKDFLLKIALLFVATFLFGGGISALTNLIGVLPLFVVAISLFVLYLLFAYITKILNRRDKIRQFTFPVKIIDNGREVEEKGYLDSGNILRDNVTDKPIMLVSFETFKKIYSGVSFMNAYLKNFDLSAFKDGHFLSVKGVTGGSKMLVFSVDELQIGGDKTFKNVMLGLSFSGFEKNFSANVLLNCGLI